MRNDFLVVRHKLRRVFVHNGMKLFQAKYESWLLTMEWCKADPAVQETFLAELERDFQEACPYDPVPKETPCDPSRP